MSNEFLKIQNTFLLIVLNIFIQYFKESRQIRLYDTRPFADLKILRIGHCKFSLFNYLTPAESEDEEIGQSREEADHAGAGLSFIPRKLRSLSSIYSKVR